jgi:predicted nucleic acid-binding protein
VEIVVSEMAKVETAYLSGLPDDESEALIREFFSRDYIVPVSVDDPVSTIARGLIRKYRNGPRLKPPDAIHLATAILWDIPIIHTTDPDLLRLDGREGTPVILVRKPLYEGPTVFPDFG